MNTVLAHGSGESRCELAKAILLYTGTGGSALATVHDVSQGAILPGSVLDRNGLSDMVATLAGENNVRTILHERALYSDASMLLWWCPSARRPIYFKSGKKELDELSGTEVLHPALVFLARSQSLTVWALKESERPTASTALYVAPYFNVYETGNMCSGNIRLPDSLTPTGKTIKEWERAFFETNFTRSNLGGQKITTFPGGHNALWKALSSLDQFPSQNLASLPSKTTLEKALNKGAQE